MLMDVQRDRIRTLRAVGAPRDPLALRLALERVLGAASFQPHGLPPGAIVCVRHLRVAMPRHEPAAWAALLDRELQDLMPRLARPFREAASARAQAVVFFDQAELLACLARDWRHGRGDAWWWRSLFGDRAGEVLVRRAFADAPIFVPAALELLADAGLASDVVSDLPAPYCERLGATVAATFAVPGWGDAQGAALGRAARVDSLDVDGRAPPRATRMDAALDGLSRAHAFTALAPPQRALLAMGLLLRRAPALVRTPGLVALLRGDSWSTNRHGSSAPTLQTPASRAVETRAATPPRENHPDSEAPSSVERTLRDHPANGLHAAGDPATARRATARRPDSRAAVPGAELPTEIGPTPPLSHAHAPSAPQYGPGPVESDFAGVVYLINIALHLELYADFAQPAAPGLALPLGDFLALVGERACGPGFRDDPVWELLAQLAGRDPGELPGRGFEPWRDDPGIPSLDAAHAESVERARLEHWVARMARTLDSRAALALGSDEDAALPFLCRRPGRLALSPTRLDAFFSLATHPLEIRVAGLDRNPGWVPAAGRVIEFHYE